MNSRISPAWSDARRVLCVRLDALGDVLMCTPAMRALRDAVPGRTLTLLGSPVGVAAVPFIPEIDAAIEHEGPWMTAAGPNAKLVERLAAGRFDAAVIFTAYTQSALPAATLCRAANIALRAAHSRENPSGLLSDCVLDPEPASGIRHEVQRQLALVRQVGARCPAPDAAGAEGLSFIPRRADFTAARACLARIGIDPGRPWLLLHPGAGAVSQRYPPALWARAMALLHEQWALPMALTGGAHETALVERIRVQSGVPSHSLAGRLALGELGAAVSLAAVAITNNSSPAHIAAAVGTPVVDLYALTNPQHTPWNVPNRVLFQDVPCRFCFDSTCPSGHHACLAGVDPERVVDAVTDLLLAGCEITTDKQLLT